MVVRYILIRLSSIFLFVVVPMKLNISGYINNVRRFILIFELVDVYREEVCGETFTKKCYISFRNLNIRKTL